ncbi:rho GTPase-activating protein 7-like isoform X2 [Anguilla anguilla]|uniref:rho GTPase-activating protein 7-like isoform X2 n=1 Tax=Anguilla anguilla TaxID=7936 RepID=UPI0015B0ABD5|nr:rho GTPase-activating protein 7-like isoform X2 [Anguilla anguilla]
MSQAVKLLLQRSFSDHIKHSRARALDLISRGARERRLAEIEAKEACDWLRAAGFPQYAQLYEDSLFPIEISSVTRDHDFLDRDAIEALCRRLNTLNKCAVMRLEITPQRKQSEDSDEDEPCAISARWTFQRHSKRWSRLDELDVFSPPGEPAPPPAAEGSGAGLKVGVSAESVLSDLSEQPEVSSLHSLGSSTGSQGAASTTASTTAPSTARADSVTSVCSSAGSGPCDDRSSEGPPPPSSPREVPGVLAALNGKPGGKSTRSKAKSFLKRMESLRLKSSPSKKKKVMSKLMIGEPVLQEGVDQEKLRRLNCVEISSLNGPGGGPRSRSVSYSGQTSGSSSSSSSQSEAGSSAVSTPSPVTRARSRSAVGGNNNNKRGGMYLEGFDPFSLLHLQPSLEEEEPGQAPGPAGGDAVAQQNRRNRKEAATKAAAAADEEEEEEEEEEVIFFIPEGHKPGTFPKALRNGSPRLRLRRGSSDDSSKGSTRRNSAGSLDSRLSFYDNVPSPLLLLDREEEEGEGEEEGQGRARCPKLDDILQHVRGLQRFVSEWSEQTCEEGGGDSDSALDSVSPCPSSPLQNRLEEAENGSDLDSTGSPAGEQDEALAARERRDSGVGASLTRSNRPQRLRWHSFQSSHRPSLSSALLQINCQSVLQMNLLQKFSLLKLTALLEKYTPTNKHGFSWAVPKFMKRIKVRDYKDRNVFGVPLQVNVQRSGQPLPQSIQQAMRYLRSQCLDQVGLFRKSGVKSRIQALRQMNEACADGVGVGYEGQSAYDVADMLKQYFRDLPEPLLTSKLSETFLQIYQYVPKDLRLQAIKAATLLLPDDHREALQTLLFFLSDVTANVAENQMTSTNLAVCLAPSLFHLNTLKRENSSPRVMHRKHSLGKPDQKDLNENLAATQGLAHMIAECKKLFQIPEEMSRCRNSYMEQGLHPPRLEELGEAGPDQAPGFRAFLKEGLDSLLKEARDKFKGYDSYSTPEQTELACKKVHDGYPLRVWKATAEVPAAPEEVLTRLLREQHRWDEDLLESKVVENLGGQTEVYQYVQNSMAPHPTRDHVVLRMWATDLPKGACAIIAKSVDHDGAAQMGVRVNVLTSRYFIEPCGSNKSRLTYICRTDCRGRCPEWYNKMFGHTCAAEVGRIRDSFTSQPEK